MGIKFSATQVLTSDLRQLVANPERMGTYGLKDTDKTNLTIHEVNIAMTPDPQKFGELLHSVHEIIGVHFVNKDIYIRLGKVFKELNIEDIDPDLQIAINQANETRPDSPAKQFAEWPLDYGPTFSPKAVIWKAKEKAGRRNVEFDDYQA